MGLLDKTYLTRGSNKSSGEEYLLYVLSFKNMCADLPDPTFFEATTVG